MRPGLRELIPVLVIFVALTSAVALILEVLVASVAGKPVDGAAATALGAVLTASVPVLGALYKLDSQQPPKPPEPDKEPEIDPQSMRKLQRIIKEYLDECRGRGPRWKLTLP